MNDLYDVLAVNMKTLAVRIIDEGKTLKNAEAIENMAVMRRGVVDEFFVTKPAGQYKAGDTLRRSGE